MKKLLTILLLFVVALALTTGEAYAYRKVTVRKGMDLVKVFAGKDTKFMIKEEIDLGGTTVNLFESGVLSAEAAILQLKAYKTYDQLSFHTARTIGTLRFVEAYEV